MKSTVGQKHRFLLIIEMKPAPDISATNMHIPGSFDLKSLLLI